MDSTRPLRLPSTKPEDTRQVLATCSSNAMDAGNKLAEQPDVSKKDVEQIPDIWSWCGISGSRRRSDLPSRLEWPGEPKWSRASHEVCPALWTSSNPWPTAESGRMGTWKPSSRYAWVYGAATRIAAELGRIGPLLDRHRVGHFALADPRRPSGRSHESPAV